MWFGLLACSGWAAETEEPMQSEPVKSEPVSQPESRAPTKAEPTSPEPAAASPLRVAKLAPGDGFEATVRIDAQPERKGFQGVWLERADGERLLLEYRPVAWLRPLAGRTVRVTGATYVPPGQAIMATHFKVDTLWVLGDPSEVPFVGFGPETTLSGKFGLTLPPPGAKNDDEWYQTFVTPDGARYLIERAAHDISDGAQVQVRVRAIEPSPTDAARRGGDWLWVLDSTPQAAMR